MDVAAKAEIEPARHQRVARSPALDDQQRDLGPAPAELVRDPDKGERPLLKRWIDKGHELRSRIGAQHAVPIDGVGQNMALQADLLSVIALRELRRNDAKVNVGERPADRNTEGCGSRTQSESRVAGPCRSGRW